MWSAIQLKSQNAFSDIENYIIIIRYAVIAEHKLAMNWVESIKETSFQLQTIAVSDAENWCYIVLIDCDQTILLRFDSDEQLKINFTSLIDDCEEDWSAVIVEQLSFTAQEQTSIVLYWLRNKKTEEYKDYMLNEVIDYQFINIQTMKIHLCQMLMIMIEIMTIVHKKALKHQINTLNTFQTDWLDWYAAILDADYT